MRAKIIADVTIVAATFMFLFWWQTNVPFPKPAPFDQTVSQVLTIMISVAVLYGGATILMVRMIEWIHKGK